MISMRSMLLSERASIPQKHRIMRNGAYSQGYWWLASACSNASPTRRTVGIDTIVSIPTVLCTDWLGKGSVSLKITLQMPPLNVHSFTLLFCAVQAQMIRCNKFVGVLAV